jgi:predicted MFS family arabinose efflux permease
MQSTAQAWLVWTLSGSPKALGIVGMCSTLPCLLLGPWTGVWVDRLDRRRLLMVMQGVQMGLALVLGALIATRTLHIWHIYGLAVILGVVAALEIPAQRAFLGDLVGVAAVREALTLNTTIMQFGRTLGASLAGVLIGLIGVAPVIWLNAASFVGVFASLWHVETDQERSVNTGRATRDVVDGLRFLRTQPALLDLVTLTFLMTVFGVALQQLFAAFADTRFHSGAAGLGHLLGASGIGALTGVFLGIPVAMRTRRPGRLLAAAVIWSGAWFVMATLASSVLFACVAIWAACISFPIVNTVTGTSLQTLAPPMMRGRLLSLWMTLTLGMLPLAQYGIGLLASHAGVPWAMRASALVMCVGAGTLWSLRPGLRAMPSMADDAPVHSRPVLRRQAAVTRAA